MSGNRFGDIFSVTTFGESHGPAMGAVIDGCPAGVLWHGELLEGFLARRRPGTNALTSGRQESDAARILSGVYEGKTLGTPIALTIANEDARPQEYSAEKLQGRRGHATDLWQEKYGHSDPRGSGRASGRETVSRVLGGAVARMLVEQLHPEVRVLAFTGAIGPIALSVQETLQAQEFLRDDPWSVDKFSLRCPNATKNMAMEELLGKAKAEGDSFGGTAQITVLHTPKNLGQPVFGKLKNNFASAFMSVGATMGFEIGEGFEAAAQSGSAFHSLNQDYGGLRGGLSTGSPLHMRVAFKPTSSLGATAKQGRHDPCIVPRALPVLEAMVWMILADQILRARLDRI